MRLYFDLQEAEEFQATRALLVRRCLTWPEGTEARVADFAIDAALTYRHETADGRLGFWTPEHVTAFLLVYVPYHIAELDSDLVAGFAPMPDSLRCLLKYLSAHDLLDPRGASLDQNLAAIKAAELHFQAEIDERDEYVIEDRETLEELEEEPERVRAYPPVRLPDAPRLAAAAEAGPVLARLRALWEWVGDGRSTSDVPDLPEPEQLLAWGKRARLIRVRKGRLLRVAKAEPLLADPLGLWLRAFEAFPEIGRAVCGRASLLYSYFEDVVPDLLRTLYSLPLPIPLIRLRIPILHTVAEPRGLEAYTEEKALDQDVDAMLELLVELGVIEIGHGMAHEMFAVDLEEGGPWRPEEIRLIQDQLSRPGPLVRITALGAYGVRWLLVEAGLEAPMVGELTDVRPAELLNVLADYYSPEAASAEIAGWLAAHDDDVDVLLAAVRACPFRNRAAVMLRVLTDALPDGRLVLPRLRSDAVLAPLVLSQLLDDGVLEPGDVTAPESLLAMTEGYLRLLELGGPETTLEIIRRQAGPNLMPMVRDILASGHPDLVGLNEFRTLVADVLLEAPHRRGSRGTGRLRPGHGPGGHRPGRGRPGHGRPRR
ncbi:hypothetical protein [Flindersiella endophytica]